MRARQNAPAIMLKTACSEPPACVTPATITIAINEAISAYSIAVAPRASFGKSVKAGREASE